MGSCRYRSLTSQRLQHTIAFANEATPTRGAKLAGVMGTEIWGWVAWASRPRSCDPPPSELRFLSVDTRTPYVVDYPGEDGDKTAHYMLRWVATTGEKGPRSETASATIGA